MNILIVDDNTNNRTILKLLLEDYMENNTSVSFDVDEAKDGQEGVSMCRKKEYDIVFMDIMMPVMDGVEATKIIRKEHAKVMIIAISAISDSDERLKFILCNGAEDYVSKPVNLDIFHARVANYITLVESRHKKGKNERGINLFTKEIFSRYSMFILSSEDALAELWEYYLLKDGEKPASLSDVVRTIFSIAEVQLKLDIQSDLYVEDDEEYMYFTIDNIDKIPAGIVTLLLKKNNVSCEYKLEEEKLSFKLSRAIAVEVVAVEVPLKQESLEQTIVNYSSEKLEVFNYIDEDDMYDLEEYAGKLATLMLIVGSGDITEEEVMEIYSYIDKLGSIISTYTEVYVISKALTELAVDLSMHTSEFMKYSEALSPMCSAFSKDFLNWIKQSFHTGAPSIDFMNDTIVVNCQTIGSMLKVDEAPPEGAEEFDDIFDF